MNEKFALKIIKIKSTEGSSPVVTVFLVRYITKNAILLKQEDLPSNFKILITDSELVP